MFEQLNDIGFFSFRGARVNDSKNKFHKRISVIPYLFNTKTWLIPCLLGQSYKWLCHNKLKLAVMRSGAATQTSWR